MPHPIQYFVQTFSYLAFLGGSLYGGDLDGTAEQGSIKTLAQCDVSSPRLSLSQISVNQGHEDKSCQKNVLRQSLTAINDSVLSSQESLVVQDEHDTHVRTSPSKTPSRPLSQGDFSAELRSRTATNDLKKAHTTKLSKSYLGAVDASKSFLKELHLVPREVPFFDQFFLGKKNFLLPVSAIADHFGTAKTREDIALGLLRFGTMTLNAHLFREAPIKGSDDDHNIHGFAADCYFIASEWFYHQLTPLFDDLKKLMPHHKHPESVYLMTIEGKKKGLESALSLLKMSQWALYRLGYEDVRDHIVYQNVLNLADYMTHYYENTVCNAPDFQDLFLQGDHVDTLAKSLNFAGKPLLLDVSVDQNEPADMDHVMMLAERNARAVMELKYALLNSAYDLMNDRLDGEKETLYSLSDTGHTLTQTDFSEIAREIYRTNAGLYYTQTMGEYGKLYGQFQRLFHKITTTHQAFEKKDDTLGEEAEL